MYSMFAIFVLVIKAARVRVGVMVICHRRDFFKFLPVMFAYEVELHITMVYLAHILRALVIQVLGSLLIDRERDFERLNAKHAIGCHVPSA